MADQRDDRNAKGQFVQGNPGGPGRPPGAGAGVPSLMVAIKNKLRENPELLDELADNVIRLALGGDRGAINAIRTLLERLDGQVPQRIELDTDATVEFHVRFPKPAGAQPQGENDDTDSKEDIGEDGDAGEAD